jgi:N-acetylmuramoyl-L-alanine amidase
MTGATTSGAAMQNGRWSVRSSADAGADEPAQVPQRWPVSGRRGLLAALLLVLFAGGAAAQQAVTWRFDGGRGVSQVRESRTQGYAALPASALLTIGAQVSRDGDEVQLLVGRSEVRFRLGSPFFVSGGSFYQLVSPVYAEGGVVFLPVQFIVEFLPTVAGDLAVDTGARVVRRDARAAARQAAQAAPAAVPPAAQPLPRPATPISSERPLLVIDAGHGGIDPGAIGPGGTREKDVVLAVSKRLYEMLRDDPRFDVRMTRDRDTLVGLRDRTRLANAWRNGERPALFMSIHANASSNRSAQGFETYFLSEAKTDDARRVAAMENASLRFEGPDSQTEAGDPLRFIFNDLRQNKYLRDSSDWAEMIQRRMAAVQTTPDRGVKQAGFVVLDGAYMPAVLVEVGFISNREEERILRDAAHQERLAQALARSVEDFFQRQGALRAGS